jgi:hypothetical protein
VKSLNQLGYHQVEETRRPKGAPDRVAIGAAGDDQVAVATVMRLLDRLGFDPVDGGALKNGLVGTRRLTDRRDVQRGRARRARLTLMSDSPPRCSAPVASRKLAAWIRTVHARS